MISSHKNLNKKKNNIFRLFIVFWTMMMTGMIDQSFRPIEIVSRSYMEEEKMNKLCMNTSSLHSHSSNRFL